MKQKPHVAIIILNWNGHNDTIECLESLSKIDYPDYKIYLVDNGSTDNSVERIKQFNKKIKLPIIYIQNKKNEGFAKGNNIGIRNAMSDNDYDYFLLLNNDIIADKIFLSNLVSSMTENKLMGVSSPLVFNYYSKNQASASDSPGRFNLKNGGGELWYKNIKKLSEKTSSFYVDYTCGSCWLIRKNVLKKAGLFNESFFAYFEEIDLAIRIQKLGFKFLVVPKAIIWHKGAVTSGKISGLKLYLTIRNMIWIERIHATNKEFFIFIFKFFTLKFLKNTIIVIKQTNRISNTKKILAAIADGFFTKRKKFNVASKY